MMLLKLYDIMNNGELRAQKPLQRYGGEKGAYHRAFMIHSACSFLFDADDYN